MKKILKLLTNRVVWVGLALLIQFGFFFYLIGWASSIHIWNNIFSLLSLIMILIVMLSDEQKPSYKMVWVFLIAIFPLGGGILYLFLGDKKFSKHRRKLLAERMVTAVGEVLESEESKKSLTCTSPLLARQSNIRSEERRVGERV